MVPLLTRGVPDLELDGRVIQRNRLSQECSCAARTTRISAATKHAVWACTGHWMRSAPWRSAATCGLGLPAPRTTQRGHPLGRSTVCLAPLAVSPPHWLLGGGADATSGARGARLAFLRCSVGRPGPSPRKQQAAEVPRTANRGFLVLEELSSHKAQDERRLAHRRVTEQDQLELEHLRCRCHAGPLCDLSAVARKNPPSRFAPRGEHSRALPSSRPQRACVSMPSSMKLAETQGGAKVVQ